MRIALVGCGKLKASTRAARDLYLGGLFRLARRYAETHDAWWVLSAAHGLVHPDEVLVPYDERLRPGDEMWGVRVAWQLARAVPPDATLVVLAGAPYAGWRGLVRQRVEEPLAGLGIGKRLAWLKRATEAGR